MKMKLCSFCVLGGLFLGVFAEGTATLADGVLTLDGVVQEVASETALGDGVTSVVMQNGGGVAFTQSVTAEKTYSIAGDGLASTGIVSVAAGKTFSVTGARLAKGSVGHVLVKRGPGTLASSSVAAAAGAPTRFVVEEGTFQCTAGDFWGGHSTANTNVTIDVREGATYDHGTSHGVVGPVELTGARFLSRNGAPYNNQWADASLDGGVTAHACATDSYMHFESWGFLGHCNCTNCAFNVEAGARLIVDGVLSNGFSNTLPNRLIKRGAGELVLLSHGGWTGGTVLEGGTVTVADPMALWTGAVTLAGDVTLNVPAGTTFVCPPVKGAGTLTKTGAGVATFPTVADTVTLVVAEAGGQTSPVKDGVLSLHGGEIALDVPAGQTLEIASLVEAVPGAGKYTDIVKTGAGTLVLPTESANMYAKLTVKGGFVDVANESCFGTAGVTVQDGAGLRFLASFNQARSRITCKGAATLDVPTGVTLGIHSNYFVSTGCTVTKTGAGTWELKTVFRKDLNAAVDFTGTTWITHEGRLKFMSGDNFHGHTGNTPLVLEAHEGAVLEIRGPTDHLPLRTVVLRGGTLHGFAANFRGEAEPLEGGAKWNGFGLNGPVIAVPSLDGRPSRILARQCHLAHGSAVTTFDVQGGAVLEVDSLLSPGQNAAVTAPNYSGLVKTGAGTLRLLRRVGTQGVFDIQDGVVELGAKTSVNAGLRLQVAPKAKLLLHDGAQVATQADLASALCASADVWMDASRLAVADGATVTSLPNLGTAGGTFDVVTCQSSYKPAGPQFVRDGIGGRGALYFDGDQALLTRAYTNRGARTQVFLVSKWTSWAGTGGKGRWGGPFSLCARTPRQYFNTTCDDNQCYGALSYQHGSETSIASLNTYGGDASVLEQPSGISVGVPYITHSGRDNAVKKIFTEIWRADGSHAQTNTISTMGDCDIDALCIGCRLRKDVPQLWGKGNANNRSYIGQIGEVLVFTRELSADETAAINAYLRSKWFGADEISGSAVQTLASPLNVDVADGEASLAADLGGTTAGTAPAVQKSGSGALRLGGAFDGPAVVSVSEGTLALRKGALPSQVDVWFDASTSDGMALDADGRVTNLVNRGSCGGAFVRSSRAAQVPPGPVWSETETINGRPALVFDGDSALALYAYTNRTARRQAHVYCVAQRTAWEVNAAVDNGGGKGKWGTPWTLGCTSATASDENVAGILLPQEGSETSTSLDPGSGLTVSAATPATGDPYLMVAHSTSNGLFLAYEKTATSVTAVPRGAKNDLNCEPLNIDIVHLATRTCAGGGPQWWGKGNANNRCWYGRMGEFIVTTEPLSYEQERELFAYLRKKWFDKGAGEATPPAWLSGVPADPVLGAQTELAMADGTRLVHAADTAALGALATKGSVDWTRIWNQDTDESSFTLFDVAGDVSLGAVSLDLWPVPTMAKLVGVGGSAADGATWSVTGGAGAGNASVSLRTDGYWITRAGSVIYIR